MTTTRRQLLVRTEQEQGLGLGLALALATGQEQELGLGLAPDFDRSIQIHGIHPPLDHRSPRELQTSGGVVVVYTVTVAGTTTSNANANTPIISASTLTTTLQSPTALAAVTSTMAQSYPSVTVAAPAVVNISPTGAPTLPPTTAPSSTTNNLVFGTTLTLVPFALAVGLPALFLLLVLCYGLGIVVYPNHKCNHPI